MNKDSLFKWTEDTPVIIDNEKHTLRFENGMTGIGSRRFWIDGHFASCERAWVYTDLDGNLQIYLIRWRDTPWNDVVYLFIKDTDAHVLFEERNKWRKPVKMKIESNRNGVWLIEDETFIQKNKNLSGA